MKKLLLLVTTIILSLQTSLSAFTRDSAAHVVRAYWDNDFFNIRGQGTDESYTNGLRFDVFYETHDRPAFLLDRVLPKAGTGSSDVRGWGLGQMMVTPTDLSKIEFQPNDYPYAGALAAFRSFYSYNPLKKYSFQTELMAGVRGPESFAAQTQTFIHRLIRDKIPMGWGNQLGTKIVANVNFIAEKQLLHVGNAVELIGGSQIYAGSIFNIASAFGTLRIGKMNPYFRGYLSQHAARDSKRNKSRLQAYLVVRPSASLVITNEMLGREAVAGADAQMIAAEPEVERWNMCVDYGVVIASGSLSISFIQKSISPMLKGMPNHEVGNFSIYYNW